MSLWKILSSDGNALCLLNSIPNLGAPGRLILPSGPSSGSDWQEHEHPPNCSFVPLTDPALFHPLAGWKEEG